MGSSSASSESLDTIINEPEAPWENCDSASCDPPSADSLECIASNDFEQCKNELLNEPHSDFHGCKTLDEIRQKLLQKESDSQDRECRKPLARQYSAKYIYLQSLRDKRPVPCEILNMVVKRGWIDDVRALRRVSKPLSSCRPPREKKRAVSLRII
jgi:hypothetical protein